MGLLAAALLGGCYLHVIHSHYATFDVMVGLMVTLALLFSLLMFQQREAKWYLLAGLCAGLAGATKYNGAIAVLIPLTAHVLATTWGEWGWLNGRLLLMVGGFAAGFLGGNPFALGNMPDFLNGLALVLHHYGTQQRSMKHMELGIDMIKAGKIGDIERADAVVQQYEFGIFFQRGQPGGRGFDAGFAARDYGGYLCRFPERVEFVLNVLKVVGVHHQNYFRYGAAS